MAEKSEKKLPKMARKRKGKKGAKELEEKLTKDETEVAKYLRWNLKTKKSAMFGEEVFYFIGSKIVDFMLDTKWATGRAKKSTVEFSDRDSTYNLLDKMIMLGLFSRVHRTYKEKEKKGKEKKDEKKSKKEEKDEEKSKDVKESPKSKRSDKDKESTSKDEKDSKEGKKKKKVKVTLEPHENNHFLDSDDAVYIWIYDPVHPKTFVMGILLVIGAVAVCLFPLWPESFRVYSWYLSVAAMVFIGLILFLAIFRYVVFGILWGLSFGKVEFWLLPNLTADCGFVESFIPVYEYTTKKSETSEENAQNAGVESEKIVDEENIGEGAEMEAHEEDKSAGKHDENLEDEKRSIEDETNKGEQNVMAENEESSGNHSGSNKETDEGEAWVKVSKLDANEKSEDMKC